MEMMELNEEWFFKINNLGKEYPHLDQVAVFTAEYMVFFLALAALIYWFTRIKQNRIMVINAAIAFILAEVVGKVAGMFHSNQQPFAELSNVNQLIEKAIDNSFPSDHTILFFSFCFTFFLYHRKSGVIWIGLALLAGISRIWVGVHYPMDILVGALIAIIAALITYVSVPKIKLVPKLLAFYEKVENIIWPQTQAKTKNY
ncbi:undecaprenyl-diphosphatase [Fredinandcohnia sp. 179-A 10B2 NHS]|uniref:undecaprenyl-diphosphatase n=1 Tax=Fredinandcohnia sp. 179-A 10B2 NHS TaxID=3235176 RepID=UPI0039A3E3D3